MRCSTTARSGWLSEDNGAYVLAFDAPLPADGAGRRRRCAPARARLVDGRGLERGLGHARPADRRAGRTAVRRRAWRAAIRRRRPAQRAGEVGTLDYSDPARAALVGRPLGGDQRAGDERPARGEREDAGRARVRMPELRRRAGGHARDARSRSPATSATRWSTSRRASAPSSRTTRRTTPARRRRAADSARQQRHAGARWPRRCPGRWWATRSAATSRQTATTSRQLLARVPAVQPQRGLRVPGRQRRRLELGRAHHRRARRCAATTAQLAGRALPQALTATPAKVTWVLGEFYWRVQRDERALRHRLRGRGAPRRQAPVARADRRRGRLVGRRDAGRRRGGRRLRLAPASARRAAARRRAAGQAAAAALRKVLSSSSRSSWSIVLLSRCGARRLRQRARDLRRRQRRIPAMPAPRRRFVRRAPAAARSVAGPAVAAGTSDARSTS